MRYPVLLHGFTGAASAWEGLVDGLSSAGHTPVLVDLPGHGRNVGEMDPERFTLESTLAGVASAGAWPADLVGYSMGGRVALHFAAAFPDRVGRLVLESSSPGIADTREREQRRRADDELAGRIEREGVPAFVRDWESLPLFETQAMLGVRIRERQRARRLANDATSLAASLRGIGAGRLPSLWDRLPDIHTPTLLLTGEADPKFTTIARRMAKLMPAAEVAVVPRCGHAVHLERPELWLAELLRFLGRG